MVQKKKPTKLSPKTKQIPKPLSFDCRDSPISKETASIDSTKRKTMKHLPNYMKPTSSSDARKDQLQVTHPNSPSTTRSSRNSNPKSFSPPSVTSKRKPITPLLKRNKSKVLFQKLNLNRATCSSTMKDSKFPKALDLNPGATESEGTSVMRVCPYTYCSLNGHVHEPMPPLKSFLASKRKLIKTQQSMKLKGFSPFRKREPKRSEKEVSPLIQEVVNDFIVEIYASAKDKVVDPVKIEERNGSESQDGKRDEEEVVSTGLDLKSEFSVEEMDAIVKLVEFVSCDQELGDIKEKCSDLVVEEKNPVGTDENCTKFESFKEFDMDLEDFDVFSDSESFSSECTVGGSDQSHDKLFEQKVKAVVPETTEQVEKQVEERIEVRNEIMEEMYACVIPENEIHNQMAFGSAQEGGEETQEDSERKEKKVPEIEPSDCSENEIPKQVLEHLIDQNSNSVVDLDENGDDVESKVVPETAQEKLPETGTSDVPENESPTQVLDNFSEEEGGEQAENCETPEVNIPNSFLEIEELERSGVELNHENKEQTDAKLPQEEVIGTEVEENNKIQEGDNPICMETELDHVKEEPNPSLPKEEAVVTEVSEMDQLCVAFSEMRIEGEDYSFDPTCQQKNRLIIARRRPMNGEDEYMRDFNPRAPRFLPVEPDPESEKVDLRHQMMDERKNSEEWMIDYALQKAVNQLAPARKKKVELLVAAFETVVPTSPVQGGGVTCS